ncbi:MAG TPA: hypothetical protein PLI65_00300 [Bacteroidales bacterium]|nr:hypothetical protein [Bacteroidales bacterium]HPR56749.1 hypothetical protein [Bacteroidales bacterium]HRW96567.1 hypothetical protein [Bacteroidales bacterium]
MKDKVATILKIFLTVLLAISAILFIVFYSTGEEFTSVMLTWGYILIALAALVTILFPLVYIIMNPRKGKTVLFGLLGFIVLYLISNAIASGSIQGEVYETFKITEAISKFIGAIMIMTYILAGLAIVSIIYSGISSIFK